MNTRLLRLYGILLSATSWACASDLPASTQGKEAIGMVNPSSRFQVEKGWNMFLNTEFLWWVPKEDGLYFAQSGFTGAGASALPPDATRNFRGHLQKANPQFRPGFRIAFGGNMSYDEWDILLNWTWYQAHARGHARGNLLVLWGHPQAEGMPDAMNSASSARAKFALSYNVLDLEMGRSFWVGRHFSLRPFMGIRGAWIGQHFKIHYDYATDPETDGKIRAESDFEGVGVRAGLDMRFSLLGGWSLYSLASASMLYGFYRCDFRERWESEKVAFSKDGFRNGASTAQLSLGVRWDTYVHKDRYHFGLYAGWEQNIWFGINKMNHFFRNLSGGGLQQMNGDLTLSGGTFGARFDF